jgi:uncharacterized coiled-coil DUF342 family protein
MNEIVLALISVIGGGVGVKLIETLFLRGNKKIDESTTIRQELREEIQDLRTDLQELEKDLTKWKDRYYELLEKYNEVNANYDALKYKHEELLLQMKSFKQEIAPLTKAHDAAEANA